MELKKIYSVLGFILTLTTFLCEGNATTLRQQSDSSKLNRIYINVKYRQAEPDDSLNVYIVNILDPTESSKNMRAQFKKVEGDGLYHFELFSNESHGYFEICTKDRNNFYEQGDNIRILSNELFWEKGDSITIDLSNVYQRVEVNSTMSFTGRGSEKYNVEQAVIKEIEKKYKERYPTDDDVIRASQRPIFDQSFNFQSYNQLGISTALEILERYRSQLTHLSYNVLKANFLFMGSSSRYQNAIRDFMTQVVSKFPEEKKQLFLVKYKSNFSDVNLHGIDTSYLAESNNALYYFNNKFVADSYVYKGKYDPLYVYNAIKSNLNGALRDRTLIKFLKSSNRLAENTKSLLVDAKEFVKDKKAVIQLDGLYKTNNSKDFLKYSLTDVNGKTVKLSKFKGKVVLMDFYFLECGACVFYYSTVLSKAERKYEKDKNVLFVAVSADKSKQKWLKSIKDGRVTGNKALNLVTNFNGFKDQILTDNDIYLYPSTVLIDRKGNVKYFNTENLYNLKTLEAAIESLK